MFADAPISVPFPIKKKGIQLMLKHNVNKILHIPPKHAPNDRAHRSGCKGRLSDGVSANETVILIIIVVSGMLSTNAEASADTHNMIRIATAKRDFSLTDKTMLCA